MIPPTLSARRRLLAAVLAAGLLAAACDGALTVTPPPATPADFPGIALELVRHGVTTSEVVAGDAGCDDPVLIPTAIGFDARGHDQADPTRIHVFIFRNQDAYERLRSQVDACLASYPGGIDAAEALDAAPFVLAGPGPWPAEFKRNLRDALIAAAGIDG